MDYEKKNKTKTELHERNKNREHYKLDSLSKTTPELSNYFVKNKRGETSIDFSNPKAVKVLNQAILKSNYGIENWNFPDSNLCPPIPGRADYIHYLADLIKDEVKPSKVTGLDIGTGATCIYPILGVAEYQWKFIATDIDPKSIESSESIVNNNPILKEQIELRLQKNKEQIFKGIINSKDQISFSMCNPPFHASKEEAMKGSTRKTKNLSGKRNPKVKLNFSGNINELIYKGGEIQFLKTMILESRNFSSQILWFTTLVSKESNLKKLETTLKKVKALRVKIIPMGTGNKKTRILAWSYKPQLK